MQLSMLSMRFSMPRNPSAYGVPLLAAFGLFSAACTDSGGASVPAEPNAARPVRVAEVRAAARDASVRAVGLLAPRDELALGFKIGGVIERIEVDEGDTVQRGALLAGLDRTEIDAAVDRAAEAVDKAARDLKRAQALYADDVATLEQVEDATTALNIARANLEAARFDARYARIEAPADGLVLRRHADPNELVQAGEPVLVIGSLAAGWSVRIGVTDRDVVQLALGDEARVAFDAFPGEVFAARIERIPSASDPATGTYEIELAIDPDGTAFVQGLVAKVELDVRSRARERLWIPVEALLEANGGYATVLVLDDGDARSLAPIATAEQDDARTDDGSVERRRVRIGELVGDSVEVREGLRAGERVVTDGAAWLADGERVTVLAAAD